jgi:hypothetical protein
MREGADQHMSAGVPTTARDECRALIRRPILEMAAALVTRRHFDSRALCAAPALTPQDRSDPAWPLCATCEAAREAVSQQRGKAQRPVHVSASMSKAEGDRFYAEWCAQFPLPGRPTKESAVRTIGPATVRSKKPKEEDQPMKLKNSASTEFFKFAEIGDVVEGDFVSFTTGVDGRFGPEDILELTGETGQRVSVRCPTSLSRTLSENRHLLLTDRHIRIEFTEERPSRHGTPMKLFDVDLDVEDGKVATPEPARQQTKPASPKAPPPPSANEYEDDIKF